MIALRSIAVHLPKRTVPTASLTELAELGPEMRAVYDALGIETVTADDGIGAHDLAVAASRRAMADAGVEAVDVGALVSIPPRVPDMFMVSHATRLQHALGCRNALAFGVGDLGCVSIDPALRVAQGLLAADAALEHVLVAHGSKPPAPRRYRHPVTINGDGGAATVVARQGAVRIVDWAAETNGAYWDLFRVEHALRPYPEWAEECRDVREYSFKLAIESRNRVRALCERVLGPRGLDVGTVDHFVMQNLSEGAFSFYEEAFGVTVAKACRDNMRRLGHLGPNDILANLRTGLDTGEFIAGDRIVVVNAAPVAAWSVWLVEIGRPEAPGAIEL